MRLIELKRWTRPDCYIGASWPEYYVGLGQHRDSDSLTRSNFTVFLKRLGGESDTVQVVRESHWAVGWVEWIAIHESDTEALRKALDMLKQIEDYPVLDESHWSELEYTEACAYWQSLDLRERIRILAECGESIFGARRDYFPDSTGKVQEYLTQ